MLVEVHDVSFSMTAKGGFGGVISLVGEHGGRNTHTLQRCWGGLLTLKKT